MYLDKEVVKLNYNKNHKFFTEFKNTVESLSSELRIK